MYVLCVVDDKMCFLVQDDRSPAWLWVWRSAWPPATCQTIAFFMFHTCTSDSSGISLSFGHHRDSSWWCRRWGWGGVGHKYRRFSSQQHYEGKTMRLWRQRYFHFWCIVVYCIISKSKGVPRTAIVATREHSRYVHTVCFRMCGLSMMLFGSDWVTSRSVVVVP